MRLRSTLYFTNDLRLATPATADPLCYDWLSMLSGKFPRRAAAISGICVITALLSYAGRHFQLDDALIYARYVRNALQGHGLVYNLGERINALTSPFFSVLLLAASWLLHGRLLFAETLLSAGFLIAACIVAEDLARWSGVLIASTSYFYFCFGMETTLFLFLIALTFMLYSKGRLDAVPTLALLATLTRFEGALLGVVIAIDMARNRRFPRLRAFLVPALIVAAYLAFNIHFYGRLLPSSAAAKFDQGFSGFWGRWPRAFLRSPLNLFGFFRTTIYVVPVAFVLGTLGIRARQNTLMNRILLPFLGSLLAFYILLNIPAYHWYSAPFIFFLLVYALAGLPRTRAAHIVLAVVIVQCTVAGFLQLRQSDVNTNYAAISEWITAHSAPNAKIASVETGTVGWYTDRYVDDIIGLTNPKNASELRHRDLYTWLEQDKPDFVVMHTPPAFGENAAAASPLYVYEAVHFGPYSVMRRRIASDAPNQK
jgi:arabinofuranosyltransferase